MARVCMMAVLTAVVLAATAARAADIVIPVLVPLTGVLSIEGTSQRNGALLMDAQSAGAWSLDIDLTAEWRLAGVVVCTQSSAVVLAQLQSGADWTFIDDRFVSPPSPMSTTVTLEITNG